ncbi:MAG: hypothetical protein ACJAQT_002796 [Akkermansiaceae bacterium]|jgi:hypothetical protein
MSILGHVQKVRPFFYLDAGHGEGNGEIEGSCLGGEGGIPSRDHSQASEILILSRSDRAECIEYDSSCLVSAD